MATPTPALAARVRAGSGENAYKCYQCKKCTTGCPVAEYADMHPAQIMRAVQLGLLDDVLASKFIWLCTGCETCTTRCPQGIDIAAVMDELRMIARREGRVRRDAPFANILKLNYDSVRRWGRLWEVELITRDLLRRPKGALDYVSMGPKMLMKGKINPILKRGDTAQMKRMVAAAEKISAERAAAADRAAAGGAAGSNDPAAAGRTASAGGAR
jgi:heterodisulfide reductase subunit C